MADAECVPTFIQWRFPWALPRLLPWMAFLGVLVWRTMRDRRNLWVLAPIGAVFIVLVPARGTFIVQADNAVLCFAETVGSYTLGLAILWLLMDVLTQKVRRRAVRLAAMAVIPAVAGAFGVTAAYGIRAFPDPATVASLFSLVVSVVFVIALWVAAKTHWGGSNIAAFMARFVFTNVAVCMLILTPLSEFVYSRVPPEVFVVIDAEFFDNLPLISLLLSVAASATAFPFLLLAFMHDTFAARLSACIDAENLFGSQYLARSNRPRRLRPADQLAQSPETPVTTSEPFMKKRKFGGMM